jgi:sulfate adenylyltransferase
MPKVKPHGGGELKPLLAEEPRRAEEARRAAALPRVRVSSREKGDLVMLGIGGFTPLEGFMGRADWEGVCGEMRTAGGLFWPIRSRFRWMRPLPARFPWEATWRSSIRTTIRSSR